MTVEGVDYAFPPRPDPTELARLGKVFACRYGGPGTSDKHLTPGEALALNANGIAICANAEGSASGLSQGFSVGAAWARSADIHFRSCGMPPDRPIYLSCDFDVTATQWPRVREALRGAASVVGLERVGIYGGYWAVVWAQRDDAARWFWQTYAWSGGRWFSGNHVEQYRNGVTIDGADCDLNRALRSDYGQWFVHEPKGAQTVLLIKTKTNDAVYISDSVTYRHLKDPATLTALQAAGHRIVEVDDTTQLEDAAGRRRCDCEPGS